MQQQAIMMNQQNMDPEEAAAFADIVRLEDETVEDLTYATFETYIDPIALFGSDAVRQQALLQNPEMTPEEVDLTMAVLQAAIIPESSYIVVWEYYDLDTQYSLGSEVIVDIDFDLEALAAMDPDADMSDAPAGILEVEYSQFSERFGINEIESIELPSDVYEVSLEELILFAIFLSEADF